MGTSGSWGPFEEEVFVCASPECHRLAKRDRPSGAGSFNLRKLPHLAQVTQVVQKLPLPGAHVLTRWEKNDRGENVEQTFVPELEAALEVGEVNRPLSQHEG